MKNDSNSLRDRALAAVPTSVRSQLFRQEVVDFQQSSRQLGRVVPLQTPATAMMFVGIIAAATATIGFLFVGQYARKEAATGYLAPAAGTARVFAPQTGTIGTVYIHQGDTVTKGQALFSVTTDQISTGGEDINTELMAALRKQKNDITTQIGETEKKTTVEHDRLTAQLSEHQNVLSALQVQWAFQKKRIENLEKAVEAGEELRPKGLISEVDIRARENALLEQKQALVSMSQQITARQGQLSEVQFNLRQLPYLQGEKIQTLRNELSGVEQRISETKARNGYVLRAPIGGYVSLLEASPGNPVDPKKLQLQIVPSDSPLQATLFVPPRAIGFVKVGQDVRIMFDAFPYQHFGTYHGQVSTVSKTMLLAADVDSPVTLREPAYTATVTLDRNFIEANGTKVSLQPDMVVRADIILERRTLAAWIFSPWRHILPSWGST